MPLEDLITNNIVGLSWFRKIQLYSIGLEEQQINYLIGLLCIVALYFIVQPLIAFLVGLEWRYLLTYLLTILLFTNIVTFGYLYQAFQGKEMGKFSPLTFVLADIVSLGVIVAVILVANMVITYLKQHKSSSN